MLPPTPMMEMNGTLSVVNQHHVERAAPRVSGPVEVVLVDTGEDLQAVADILRDAMGLCIPDPRALEDALPLILFEELPMMKAEILARLMARAGGRAEVRPQRERYQGIKRSIRSRRKAA